ncbi:selection and upkeep of intraepithelial T-cells protein 1-like [Chanodichthys erythropterus]|uniref:selection and upkeep of intraepithelial T-cells protein 1-like n=1 Tax=Chanodichthys erythropterus TaxID=933992 RepID=UPI00351DAC4D
MIRCSFLSVFAVLVNKVSLQVTVEAVIGGSVDLLCSSTELDHKLQDIDVKWRHNGSKIVYDIIKGQDSLVLQDQRYKNRTKTFPDEYLRGNFSININNLTHDDAGKYICFITHSDELQTVLLHINESTAKGNKSHDQTGQGEEKGADNIKTSVIWVCIVVAVLLLVVVVLIIHCLSKRKRNQAFFSVKTDGERAVTQTGQV